MQAKKNKATKRFRLTCTNNVRTLYDVVRFLLLMDATTKKMIEKLNQLRMEIGRATREAQAIEKALEVVGIKPPNLSGRTTRGIDERYSESQPFSKTSLVETCRNILIGSADQHLTKSQVEYLATMGGYQFQTDDPTNSVEVTLRRLAEKGFCQVKKGVGPHESEYWWNSPNLEPEDLDVGV